MPEPWTEPPASAAREALVMDDGPPVSDDPVPGPITDVRAIPVDLEAGSRLDPETAERDRLAVSTAALLAAGADVVVVATADADDSHWEEIDGAIAFHVRDVLRGTGLAVGDAIAVSKPPPGDERCACERPNVHAAERYLLALVAGRGGTWSFARSAQLGILWAPVSVDPATRRAVAMLLRGGAVAVDDLRGGGA